MKKIVLFLCVLFNACATPSISTDEFIMMSDKLRSTEWSYRKNSIYFYQNEVQLKVGNLLGTKETPFEIIDQDSEYVVYLIFKDIQPTLLGVMQVDHKTIKLLWWPASNFDPRIVKDTITKQGMTFKIRKRLNP